MARKFTKRVTNNLISITKIGVIAILLATTFSAKAQTTHITSFNQTGLYAATCYINGSPTLTGATITGDITLADGLSIPEFAFNDNTNITSVKALGSIGTIGGWAFSNCNVNTITFGNVTTIESDAFRGCKAGVITFGDVTTINRAFRDCNTDVITFGDVTTISGYAFPDCNADVITFGDVTTIRSGAFRDCKADVITFGDVGTINGNVFTDCNADVITFGDVTTINDPAFSGCNADVITFGDVTTINGLAFSGCSATLTFVKVTTINSNAFTDCKADVITFGDVTTINNNAFRNYTSLVSLTFGANPPNVTNNNIFTGCTSLTTIYVPDMYALKAYKAHPFWGSLLPAGVTLEAIDKTPIPRAVQNIGRINIKQGKVEIKPRD